ncbi:hypothetical protein [Streptomyces sp. NPDC047043]|uniref:hypothetical protein n=1 Tax=Streptomyces sp. NPDC047043 TaxID=3154497 RepID=UPI0033FFBE61
MSRRTFGRAGRRQLVLALAAMALLVVTACSSGSSAGRAAPSVSGAISGGSTASSPNPFAGDDAWIAYQTSRSGTEGVWLIHPDGTDDHRIAAGTEKEQLLPDWSPDGKRIVFTTRGGATEPLYAYDLATKRARQLFQCADPCVGDDEPAYSPDGKKVAFSRALAAFVDSKEAGDQVPSDCGLWIGTVAGGKVEQITSNTRPACDREYNPRWSPDGSRLTYWRDPYRDGKPTGTAVYTVAADGTHERRLTDPKMFAGDADWSPDGRWIVFSTYPLIECNFTPKISNLYRIHPDGTGLQQLTHNKSTDLRSTQPRYTPDGKWIVLTAVKPDSRSLWAVPADGGTPDVIAEGGLHAHGTWQP